MKTSEQIDKLAEAMAKAQGELKPALKDSVNPAFRSKYADLTSVWDACRGPLTTQGLVVWQDVTTEPEGIAVTTRIAHTSGQWVEFGPLTVPLMKHDAHGVGSATSYAKRYALSAAVGVVSDDDDDGAQAVERAGRPPAATPEVTGERTKIAAVTSKTGTSPKTGKPWTRFDVAFEDGRTASTFDQQMAGLAQRIAAAKVLVTPTIEQDGRNLRLVGLETDGEVPQDSATPFDYEGPSQKGPSPEATAAERQALLLKVSKLSDTLKLTDDEKRTYWTTYCERATKANVDPAALQDLIKFLETRAEAKGVAA